MTHFPDRDIVRVSILAELERLGDRRPSNVAICEATGISAAALSNWLNGKKTVTTETASKVLEHLGLAVRRGRG